MTVIDLRRTGWLGDGLIAGAVAGLLSGAPSTIWTLARRGDLLESTTAAGTIILPEQAHRSELLVAGAAVHGVLSVSWGVVVAALLPRRAGPAAGATAGVAAGAAIAVLDLGVIGRHLPRIRALRPLPQVLDHLAFGVVAAVVLRRLRSRRSEG